MKRKEAEDMARVAVSEHETIPTDELSVTDAVVLPNGRTWWFEVQHDTGDNCWEVVVNEVNGAKIIL